MSGFDSPYPHTRTGISKWLESNIQTDLSLNDLADIIECTRAAECVSLNIGTTSTSLTVSAGSGFSSFYTCNDAQYCIPDFGQSRFAPIKPVLMNISDLWYPSYVWRRFNLNPRHRSSFDQSIECYVQHATRV